MRGGKGGDLGALWGVDARFLEGVWACFVKNSGGMGWSLKGLLRLRRDLDWVMNFGHIALQPALSAPGLNGL